MKDYPDDHFDSCVTDPPYGLAFMNKTWDMAEVGPFTELWAREVLRVLKPGAHLMAFGGTRTYHRMTCAIEDVGFEIRDCLMWLYGSGFPKSMDVGKTIDKAIRGVPQGGSDPTSPAHGKCKGGCSEENPSGRGFGAGPSQFMREQSLRCNRQLVPEAEKWSGWGTALKPAYEPIVLARKPLQGTVAKNALKYGTGGINVDGCRIEAQNRKVGVTLGPGIETKVAFGNGINCRPIDWQESNLGRWPSNLILDEISAKMLDEQSGESRSTIGSPRGTPNQGLFAHSEFNKVGTEHEDSGGASRFFYIAKASRGEREKGLVELEVETSVKNVHPTVKPLELMGYLVRLVTPKGGLCLDPFLGSGTTLIACMLEGMDALGIEKERSYEAIIQKRLEFWKPIAEGLKTEQSQERKERLLELAKTLKTLDSFESEDDEEQLGDSRVMRNGNKIH